MGYNSLELNEARIAMAELELESMTSLFNNMLVTCRNKCIIPRYGEPELSKGETACIDRCVAKFVKSNQMISEYMKVSGNGPETLSSFRSTAAQAGVSYFDNESANWDW